jgi:teichuronic acid exporter
LQTLFLQILGFTVVLMTWRYEHFVQLPRENRAALRVLTLVVLMGLVGTLVATPLIVLFDEQLAAMAGAPALRAWLLLVPVTSMLMCIAVALQNFVQRQGRYRQSTLSELANKGTYVGSALLGFWALPGPAGLMLATAGGTSAKIAWLLYGMRACVPRRAGMWRWLLRQIRGRCWSLRRVASRYIRLSGSMVASHLLMSGTAIIPSIYIARAYGTEQLGQFALASASIYLPTGLIGNAIGQVYYQRAAQKWATGESFVDLWRTTSRRLVMIGLPVYAVAAVVSIWLYPLVFGEVWVDAGKYASILSISAFFSFLSTPLDRGCLVVDAWLYIPAWHAARTASTAAVVWLASLNHWGVSTFVIALAIQMSLLFLIDYRAEYLFARRRRRGVAA